LLGIDCAKNHLGIDMVARLRRGLRTFERRQKAERQLGDLLVGVGDALGRIERWLQFDSELSQAISQMIYAWPYLRTYWVEPFPEFPELRSNHSSLLSASELMAIVRAKDSGSIKPAELELLARGRSDAIVCLESFVRRCTAARTWPSPA
jgi:hypothetical protein